jgi:HEPN domain-containing protein
MNQVKLFMKKQVKEWLYHAQIDLLSAEKLLEEENLTQSTAFHCHQVIEKSLKAIIENLDLRIPHTHDVIKLYSLVRENNISLTLDEDIIAQINEVYIDSRYPSNHGLIPEGKPSVAFVTKIYEYSLLVFKEVKELLH